MGHHCHLLDVHVQLRFRVHIWTLGQPRIWYSPHIEFLWRNIHWSECILVQWHWREHSYHHDKQHVLPCAWILWLLVPSLPFPLHRPEEPLNQQPIQHKLQDHAAVWVHLLRPNFLNPLEVRLYSECLFHLCSLWTRPTRLVPYRPPISNMSIHHWASYDCILVLEASWARFSDKSNGHSHAWIFPHYLLV